jgi:hypothetical protein
MGGTTLCTESVVGMPIGACAAGGETTMGGGVGAGVGLGVGVGVCVAEGDGEIVGVSAGEADGVGVRLGSAVATGLGAGEGGVCPSARDAANAVAMHNAKTGHRSLTEAYLDGDTLFSFYAILGSVRRTADESSVL